MDIVIVAQYLDNLEHLEMSNGRFVYLARMLAKKNKVEIVTTTFLHSEKHQAKVIPSYWKGVKITPLYEPGYPQNICLKRLESHRMLAENVKNYLEKRTRPDVLYAAVPSLSLAYEAAKYCKKNRVRFIIDIQDLWPEAFKMIFNIPLISDLIFMPMTRQANQIYSLADEIVAVSHTYADRALRVNKKCRKVLVAYLGTDKHNFDKYAKKSKRLQNSKEIRIVYVGSLSRSYDIHSVIEAIKIIENKVHLIVIGDGPLKESFKEHAQSIGIKYTFVGRLPYSQMVEQLCNCDIAVNPICKGSAGSIINKVGDYAMAGLPVINTQESQEYRELIEIYQAGLNCICGDTNSIADAMKRLIDDKNFRNTLGKNSRKLGEDRFDRRKSYQKIVDCIEKL